MTTRAQRITWLLACTLLVTGGSAYGQDELATAPVGAGAAAAPGGPGGGGGGSTFVNTEAETLDRMTVKEDLTPYGVDLLGERLDLTTGSLTFQHVDVSIPGNSGLEVAVRRSLRTSGGLRARHVKAFGDWSLDVPSLSMTVATVDGWHTNRCSSSSEPDQVYAYGVTYMPWNFWNGLSLNIPGQGSQRVFDSPNGPFDYSTAIRKGTNQFWKIECLTSIQNGAGEGFVATSPAGIKYTFNYLVYEDAPWVGQLERDTAFMMATKVEDRHGNYVNYNYTSGKLTSISSSDSRAISISYSGGRISSITAGGRTWTYTYTNGRLTKVTLPTGLYWTISVANLVDAEPHPGLKLVCSGAEPAATGYIVHPYGARGDYTLNEVAHGRSDVPYQFVSGAGSGSGGCIGEDVRYQRSYDTMSLTQKKLTGPGLPTMTWNYTYSQTQGGWTTSSGVSDVNTTMVVDPDGDKIIHSFDRTWTWQENAEVKTRIYDGTATLLRTVDRSYTADGLLGTIGATVDDNQAPARQPRAMSQQVITQAGETYTTTYTHNWGSSCYNYTTSSACYSYGRPSQVSQSNSANSHSRTEVRSYLSDQADWQLALPRKTTVGSETPSETLYNSSNLPATLKSYGVTVATRGYGSTGLLSWEKGANNHQTSFSNYKRGLPQTITYADSGTRTFVIDYFGNVTQATDREGNTTEYDYDDLDRLEEIDYPDESGATRSNKVLTYGTVTSADINQSGSGVVSGQWKQTKTRGSYSETRYLDAMLRPVLVRTEDTTDGSLTRFSRTTYDSKSQPVFRSFPSASAAASDGTESDYDGLGRVKELGETVSPYATTTYAYLGDNRIRVTNPRGKQTTTTYFALGAPDSSLPTVIQQPEGVTTTITRNDFGEMTQVTQAGGTVSVSRTYRYDSRHNMCRQIDPETGSTAYSYDNAGRLSWYALAAAGSTGSCDLGSVPSNQRIVHSYNNLNQLTLVNYPDSSPDVSYSYDGNGNLATLNSSSANRSYGYDKLDNLTSEQLVTGGQTFTVGYQYDTRDRLTKITYPTGLQVPITPNAYGAAKAVGGYASAIGYHENGAIETLTYGNGRVYTTTQNARTLPAELKVMDGSSTIARLTHSYDPNGNITFIDDAVHGASYDRSMGYDNLDRLTSASGDWGSGAYTYDALGNIETKTEGGQAMTYHYNYTVHRLTSISGANAQSFGYDAYGNVTSNASHGFTYNRAGNLTSSTSPSISYQYDGHKRRVQQTQGGQTEYTMYSQAGTLLHKKVGGVTTDYIYAGQMLIAKNSSSGGLHYLHTDLLGSPIKGKVGATSFTEHYTPWGEKKDDPIQLADDVGYTGHQSDTATGLTYMQARYYDPAVGRFLAVDPVGFTLDNPMSFNRYSYVNNNPLVYIDPTGEVAQAEPLALCGAGPVGCGVGIVLTAAAIIASTPAGQEAIGELIGGFGAKSDADDAEGNTDKEIEDLTEDLDQEIDQRGRAREGQFVDESGTAQDALDSLTGDVDDNGQKILPDGSRAGIHSSTGRSGGRIGEHSGNKTLHINRPSGKRDIKIRYPNDTTGQ